MKAGAAGAQGRGSAPDFWSPLRKSSIRPKWVYGGWTAGTARGGTGHLGLTHTETQRGRLRTACGQRRVDSKNSQTIPATTSTSSIRQLLGAADAQTAHPATSSTAPAHQPLGSANAETTPARAPAAAADRTRRNMRREERVTVQGPVNKQPDGMSDRGVQHNQPLGITLGR